MSPLLFFISFYTPKKDRNLFLRFLKKEGLLHVFLEDLTYATKKSVGTDRDFIKGGHIPIKNPYDFIDSAFPWECRNDIDVEWSDISYEWGNFLKNLNKKMVYGKKIF